jgi:predicted nuclease of restriction endonuclease-like RecB superfamily
MPADIRLFDRKDASWIGQLLDLVERSVGEPWRVLLERIEHAPPKAHASRVTAVVHALRRVTGTGAETKRIAREARALVLGHPALDRDTRDARIAAAACTLQLAPDELERHLWADLAMERPVTLPRGRPAEITIAAYANLDRIQRAVRRATELRLTVGDDAHELVRTIARCGLLAQIQRVDGATVLDITGALSVFHATSVYGRALALLVPLLAEHERFTLDIKTEMNGHLQLLRVEPPVLLPAMPGIRRKPGIADRLAQDLVASGYEVTVNPPPLQTQHHVLYPELLIEEPRCFIEAIGFATMPYIEYKEARYRETGERFVLCIDATRAHFTPCATRVPYERRVEVHRIEAVLLGEVPD